MNRKVCTLVADPFEVGALVALGLLCALHDQPSMAVDVVREMGLENADVSCAGLSEYDQENLTELNRHGLNLKF